MGMLRGSQRGRKHSIPRVPLRVAPRLKPDVKNAGIKEVKKKKKQRLAEVLPISKKREGGSGPPSDQSESVSPS